LLSRIYIVIYKGQNGGRPGYIDGGIGDGNRGLEDLHSKRVKKMENYTRNEWRRWKTTLETSEEDGRLHSKRVEKIA
jgi:hypothetical protein